MEAQPEAAGSAAVSPETEAKLSKARVEKLKRRIIRAVAVKTSQNPDEKEMQNMWEMMNRSSKCDCKVLWKHMRAVTLKKLKRLLPAEDRIENITAIARLTITDWLLFDLVLVHENIDVIGRDLWEKDGEEPEPLMELFFLVDEYKIEQLKGRTELIDAWLKLTREYNDGGRKCSPMLLQRRWYQMKEATRKRFYDFWGHYRGNPTHMSKAKRFQPTALQVDIVRKNKMLIVSSFTEWNELIANGRVILANEFDDRINALRKGTELTDAGPELEVIEQEVETISLEGDSDEGDLRDDSNENSVQNDVAVKREPEDNDLIEIHENNIDILRSINIPCETPFGNTEEEPPPLVVLDDKQLETNEETCLIDGLDQRKNKEGADDSDIVEEICNIDNEVSDFAKTVSDTATKEVCKDLEANIACDESSDSDNVELTDIFNSSQLVIETPFLNQSPEVDIIKQENYIETENNADEQAEPCKEQTNIDYLPRIENVTSMAQCEPTSTENQVKSILDQETNELALNKDRCLTETNDFTNNSVINDLAKVIIEKIANDRELLGNFEELPSDIHFADDGIVLDDDVEDISDFKVKVEVEESIEETNDEFSEDTQSGKIDLKLLLFPTVYTKKLDHMDVFKFIEYDHIRDGRIIEFASIESKPIDSKSIKLEDISSSKNYEHHSNLGSESSDQEDTLFKTEQQTEITTEILQSNQESGSSDEEEIPLNTFKNRVHIKSWLLKKPCVQNYNPIQLCKNPDFNTRLKRLTAGFLSYERNRKYLKRCHPLTIDLHKAFEDKLSNNTLYLKGVDLISNEPAPSTKDAVTQPIPISSPSFPQNVSSDNEADVIDIISNSPLVCERNKVINLPDITEIRRLNQNLLTAEVAPLQIAATSPPEMNAPDVINFEPIDQNKPTTQEDNTSKINSLILGSDSCGSKQDDPSVDKSFIASNHTQNSEDSGRIDQTISESNKSISGKKQQQKPKPHRSHNAYNSASWITKSLKMREEEFLLASDTVDKMLFLFTGEDIKKKKTITRVMKHFNETRDIRENSLKVLTEELNLKESSPISVAKNEESIKCSSQDLTALKPKKRKSIVYCCWASKKYAHPNLKQRHPCKKPLCTCCCKEKLIGKVILEDKKQQPRNDPIILSDEEEKDPVNMQTPKKVCIVNVVSNNSLTEFPKATSIVIDGKSNKVNVPNHIIRNNDSSSNENDVINSEPSTLCTNNVNSMPNQSNLQIVHNITDAADNSSELPLQLTVALNETVVTQGDTRVLNTEQLMIPTIPPLMESLTPCQESRNITITVKANQPNENTLPNHSISYSLSDVTPQTTLLPPLVVPKPKKAGRKSIRPRINTTLSYANPPKPLELPNRTVRVKVKNQEELSSSPIFVGRNKILLSTVKSPFPPRMSIDPPKISLPNGVHFVLLPNNELALSIEPGVELNNNQLSHLQSVIQTLQHFLGVPSKCMNIIDNTPIVIDDDENQKPQDLDSKDTERNKENDQLDTENEIESMNHLETYTQTDERTEESSITSVEKNSFTSNDKPENVEHNKDMSSTISNTEREIVNDNDNSEKTSNDISRKTILSDLMEMSGISEEDAKLPETPVLPAIPPDIGLTPLEKGQDKSLAEMHPDILRLFNTPIALASLARRPDLSIITTYSDLKYSFYKEAKFFKLDVTTGDIVRINVFIKNKDNIRSSLNPPKRNKTQLIDLTDDDSENDIVIDSEVPNTEAENSVNTADTHSEAKPLKLFRAMHPSLLRNNLKCKGTELIPSAVRSGSLLKKLDGKNILKIVNIDRRKQNLKVVKPINMETVVDEEKLQEPSQLEVVHTNECSADDSDDEPLAKISKRNKQEQNAITSDQNQNIESTESIDIPMESAAFVEVANPMMYEALDPEFGSLENDCEEDCILGV